MKINKLFIMRVFCPLQEVLLFPAMKPEDQHKKPEDGKEQEAVEQ